MSKKDSGSIQLKMVLWFPTNALTLWSQQVVSNLWFKYEWVWSNYQMALVS